MSIFGRNFFGVSSFKFIVPQIDFYTLLQTDSKLEGLDERVDFLVTAPNGRQIVIEVDGNQHNEPDAKEIDQKRDSLLEENGFRVIRISASSVSENAEPSQLVCKKTGRTLDECLFEFGIKQNPELGIQDPVPNVSFSVPNASPN